MDDKIIEQLDRIEEKLDKILSQANDIIGAGDTLYGFADGSLPVVDFFLEDEWPEFKVEIGDIDLGDIDE